MDASQFKQVHSLVKEGMEAVLEDFGETGTILYSQLLSSVEEVFGEPKFYGIDIVPSGFNLPESLETKGPVGKEELVEKLKWEINFFSNPTNWFGINHYVIGMRVKAKTDFVNISGSGAVIEPPSCTLGFHDLIQMHNVQEKFYSRPVASNLVNHWCDRKKRLRIEKSQLEIVESMMSHYGLN